MDLSTLSAKQLRAAEEEFARSIQQNRLFGYVPYLKQAEFHNLGASTRERLLMAGNQLGKSLSAAAETAMHLTGHYPVGWRGHKMTGACRIVVAGVTAQLVRDSCQVLLCGAPARELGTGYIPQADLIEAVGARGVPGAFDMVRVKHHNDSGKVDGESLLYFRAYEQGRERIQALTLDAIWLDEEPPMDYYMESMTRTNVVLGPVYLTFTPLQGMSDVVRRYLHDKSPNRSVTVMTIHDVGHYTPEQRQAIIDSYPKHERDARTMGVPTLGSGAIFPVDEAMIRERSMEMPRHWPRLAAMDFGWDHPTAAVWGSWDRDTDTVHIYDAYRIREQPAAIHAAAFRARGEWIPMVWPHDGLQHDKGAGVGLAAQYRKLGVNMCQEMAMYPVDETGTMASRVSVEAGVADMLNRFTTGRLKVAEHLHDWFDEFRTYHRKDGRIVKENDDLMSATRYLLMMLRHAVTEANSGYGHAIYSDPTLQTGRAPATRAGY